MPSYSPIKVVQQVRMWQQAAVVSLTLVPRPRCAALLWEMGSGAALEGLGQQVVDGRGDLFDLGKVEVIQWFQQPVPSLDGIRSGEQAKTVIVSTRYISRSPSHPPWGGALCCIVDGDEWTQPMH